MKPMKLYQAPLEGITSYIYRNALQSVFGGVDKYFTPFISPYVKRIITNREKNQLCPENNTNQYLVPQIMSSDAPGVRALMDWLHENYAYEEFNFNFGCPSGTVVSKGRGAGALRDLTILKRFLDEVMDGIPYRISVKTRLGMRDAEEFYDVLELYNRYQFEEIIIHPRVREEFYDGMPHMEIYQYAAENSKNPVVYNGSLFSVADYEAVLNDYGEISKAVMFGRGMLRNPAIFREIKGGPALTSSELEEYLHRILDGYTKEFSGETPVLYKMKEIWVYMGEELVTNYGVDAKLLKKIKKSRHLSEYRIYEKEALRCM